MLIERIWRSQPGKYFCVSTKSASGKWRDNLFKREDLKRIDKFVADNSDKDVYFCPHGFDEPHRKKVVSALPSLLWSDMDEIDPREVKYKPTIAIESSPGRYVGLWALDKPCTEELNKRMAIEIEEENGGWDVTQVLRFPGTINYKYQSHPKVRILWMDGPSYKIADLERKLPKISGNVSTTNTDDALAVYKKYEKAMPPWLRRELLNGKPSQGKRSEMIWKLTNTLVECGVDSDDCFTLLRASPWNKFRGRDDQLRREIEKSSGKKFVARDEKKNDYRFLTKSLEEVEEEEIDWIWYPYLARGELSILEGDPAVGKSYLAQMVSTHIVDGERLPSVKKMPVAKGKVAYFDIENSAGTVTKKRLLTNGCENLKDYYQEEEPFTIDDEGALEEVYDAIERLKPVLVVFDTLNTYIGKADIHKSNESQQAFAHFKDIAKRFNCAVLVLRHLTKGTRERALYRGQGSIAFAGFARVVMTVGLMPSDPETRVMAVTKLNITRAPKAITYTITELPDTIKERDRSRFDWGKFVDITSDDIVAPPEKRQIGNEREEAAKFLRDELKDGPVEAAKLESLAETKSISWRTIQRAADAIGIKKKISGFGKGKKSLWALH